MNEYRQALESIYPSSNVTEECKSHVLSTFCQNSKNLLDQITIHTKKFDLEDVTGHHEYMEVVDFIEKNHNDYAGIINGYDATLFQELVEQCLDNILQKAGINYFKENSCIADTVNYKFE